MNRETLANATKNIDNFTEKFGENFFDAIMEDDNSTYEMAKSIISVFCACENDRDFEIADNMLIACCGYSFEAIVERIQELDNMGHHWEWI